MSSIENASRVSSFDLKTTTELGWALSTGLIFTVLRWIANWIVLGHPLISQKREHLHIRQRFFEEVWLIFWSFNLLVASWIAFARNETGASVFNTHPIVQGWPKNHVAFDVLYLLRIETGWYVHQWSRGWTASGVPLDQLMFVHHIVTLIIIRFCFWKNLLLLGVLTVAIFNISNPFLHLSKMIHVRGWNEYRPIMFSLFGITFFVSRVVLFPLTIMKMGYVDAYKEDYIQFGPRILFVGNLLLLVLYGMQIYWMYRIFLVLFRGGRTGSTPTKNEDKETVFSDGKPIDTKAKDL